eukprot:2811876-Pyramimonas_sp.AAC.1
MLNVATGAAWPKDRKQRYIARYAGNTICDRCQASYETALHREWQCEMNRGNKAYDMSDKLISQALTQVNAAEAFWLRGLIPAAWVAAPPPPSVEQWWHAGIDDLSPGCMGHGSDHEPVFVCGDASGGKGTGSNKLRRVGLAIVRMPNTDRSLAH